MDKETYIRRYLEAVPPLTWTTGGTGPDDTPEWIRSELQRRYQEAEAAWLNSSQSCQELLSDIARCRVATSGGSALTATSTGQDSVRSRDSARRDADTTQAGDDLHYGIWLKHHSAKRANKKPPPCLWGPGM